MSKATHSSRIARARLGLSAATLVLIPAPLFAQTPPSTASEAENAHGEINEITVTARRRDERLQDVPIAVSVLSGEAVRAAGIERFEDMQRAIPALQIQGGNYGNSTPTFTIRSQRNGDSPITVDPAVSVYFAEVPAVRAQGLGGAMFDLGSVQVLKGPQGTLFGRNTTGGAIVLTPAAPTNKFEGYGRITIGNYDTHNVEGMINIPLADWMQLRLGGVINRHDGYVQNLLGGSLNNAKNESWRASLKLEPIDGLVNSLVVNGWHADESGPASRPLGSGPIATLVFPTLPAQVAIGQALPFYTVANGHPGVANGTPFNSSRSTIISNITSYDLTPELTIKNIFGYRFVEGRVATDLDGTPLAGYLIDNFVRSRQYSNELQLAGKGFDGHLDYIIGAFYYRENGHENSTSYRPGVTPAGLSPYTYSDDVGDTKNISKSLFAQGTLRVPGLERLSLTAGGRYTWDTRELTQSSNDGTYNPVTGEPTVQCKLTDLTGARLNPCTRSLSKDFNKFTYTLTVDYKIADDVLVYAAHRTGYRSGGFNQRAGAALTAVPFRPENVADYEIGLKSEFQLGGAVRARFNIAGYITNYDDIQRSVGFVDALGNFLGSRVENAAKARIKGIEPELTLFFGDILTLNGYYSYSKGKYLQYLSPNRTGGVDDLTPSPFAGAPINSGGVNVTLKVPVSDDTGEIKLIGNYYAQSKSFGSDNTYTVAGGVSPFNIIPAYQVANARIEWNDVMRSGFSAALYAKNIFKEQYYTGALDVVNQGLGVANAYLGDPRTFGVEFTMRW